MAHNAPLAQPDGVPVPAAAAAPAQPLPHIGVAPPVPGAAQTNAAPAPRRSRNPRGPVPPSSSASSNCAPAMLELAAAFPMHTDQRRSPNLFVPDSQMLFHVLGICDQMMVATERFLRSSPAWIPIVSQLYISVLWNTQILRVYVNSGYGAFQSSLLDDLIKHLRIDECYIPGPLVPFFQALAAVNGPFDWIGDILPGLPGFSEFWNAATHTPSHNHARQIPIPAIMLDQLIRFGAAVPEAGQQSTYTTFMWYDNIFSVAHANVNNLLKIGPQTCGSLYSPQAQHDAARNFWSSALRDHPRINIAAGQPALANFYQLFGFSSQANTLQISWFQQVVTVMQKYAQYFNGSVPLKSILPTGIGATVVIGNARPTQTVSDWLYPPVAQLTPFSSTRFTALRAVPNDLAVFFSHADHEVEEQAEQYAILTHINIDWSTVPNENADFRALEHAALYTGAYWNMQLHRSSGPVSIAVHYAQVIASRYHQQAANRVE